MAWFRPVDGRLTSEDIRAIIRAEMAPVTASLGVLSAKVDSLSVDHVTRSDMSALRTEMQTGFSALETRFMSKELAQQRYDEVTGRIGEVETAQEAARGRTFTLGTTAVGWIIMSAGLIISLVSLIIVIARR
ncbi:MAG: hypothetical protein KGH75_00670 [Rhodospirillales bacterium]|nr:hypothetical protein [Rhodospirillales bacterium]